MQRRSVRTDEDVLDFDRFVLAEEDVEGEVRRAEEGGAVGLGERGVGDDISFHEASDRGV